MDKKDEHINLLNQIIERKDEIILEKDNRIAELEKKIGMLRGIIANIHTISDI